VYNSKVFLFSLKVNINSGHVYISVVMYLKIIVYFCDDLIFSNVSRILLIFFNLYKTFRGRNEVQMRECVVKLSCCLLKRARLYKNVAFKVLFTVFE